MQIEKNNLKKLLTSNRIQARVCQVIQAGATFVFASLLSLVLAAVALAQENSLHFHVSDTANKPISGVILSIRPDAATTLPTDEMGQTHIQLSALLKAGDKFILQVVQAPEDMVMISPWDNQITLTSAKNDSPRHVSIVLGRRGDRTLLKNSGVLTALVFRMVRYLPPGLVDEATTKKLRQEELKHIAELYGLPPEEVDRSIREWGVKTSDSYGKGLVALYEGNFSGASNLFSASLKTPGPELKPMYAQPAQSIIDKGQSLYQQGEYEKAIAYYQQALILSPGDVTILNELGIIYAGRDRFSEAEAAYRQAINIAEKDNPPGLTLAIVLDNLAILYIQKNLLAQAMPLLDQSVSILKSTESSGPEFAKAIETRADIDYVLGHYDEAVLGYKQFVIISQEIPGTDPRSLKEPLHRIGEFYLTRGDCAQAELWYRRVQTLTEGVSGPYSSAAAAAHDDLGNVYQAEGNYERAEMAYNRALEIRKQIFDPEDLVMATSYSNLAVLYTKQGKNEQAESLFKQAISISENELGQNARGVATIRKNFAILLRQMNLEAAAEKEEAQANEILRPHLKDQINPLSFSARIHLDGILLGSIYPHLDLVGNIPRSPARVLRVSVGMHPHELFDQQVNHINTQGWRLPPGFYYDTTAQPPGWGQPLIGNLQVKGMGLNYTPPDYFNCDSQCIRQLQAEATGLTFPFELPNRQMPDSFRFTHGGIAIIYVDYPPVPARPGLEFSLLPEEQSGFHFVGRYTFANVWASTVVQDIKYVNNSFPPSAKYTLVNNTHTRLRYDVFNIGGLESSAGARFPWNDFFTQYDLTKVSNVVTSVPIADAFCRFCFTGGESGNFSNGKGLTFTPRVGFSYFTQIMSETVSLPAAATSSLLTDLSRPVRILWHAADNQIKGSESPSSMQYLINQSHHAWDHTPVLYVFNPKPVQFATMINFNPGRVYDGVGFSGLRRSLKFTDQDFSRDFWVGESPHYIKSGINAYKEELLRFQFHLDSSSFRPINAHNEQLLYSFRYFSDFFSDAGQIWKLILDNPPLEIDSLDLPGFRPPHVKAIDWFIIPH
jgi:tetratricopeptide (TPR) repeat protein